VTHANYCGPKIVLLLRTRAQIFGQNPWTGVDSKFHDPHISDQQKTSFAQPSHRMLVMSQHSRLISIRWSHCYTLIKHLHCAVWSHCNNYNRPIRTETVTCVFGINGLAVPHNDDNHKNSIQYVERIESDKLFIHYIHFYSPFLVDKWKYTEMNRQTESRQTKYTKVTQKYLCTYICL